MRTLCPMSLVAKGGSLGVSSSFVGCFSPLETLEAGPTRCRLLVLDLSFGRNFVLDFGSLEGNLLNDRIWADGTIGANRFSHPNFADSGHRKNDGFWNRLIDAVHDNPTIQEMYLRRLRSLMDQIFGAPNDPSNRPLDDRITELETQIAGDVALDRARWGNPFGANRGLSAEIDTITDD